MPVPPLQKLQVIISVALDGPLLSKLAGTQAESETLMPSARQQQTWPYLHVRCEAHTLLPTSCCPSGKQTNGAGVIPQRSSCADTVQPWHSYCSDMLPQAALPAEAAAH